MRPDRPGPLPAILAAAAALLTLVVCLLIAGPASAAETAATPAPTATTVAEPTAPPTATQPAPTATTTVAEPAAPPTATQPAPTATQAAAPAAAPAATIKLAISKTLEGSDLVQVGAYLTFTIRISNTGDVTVTTLPLVDEYDATVLQPISQSVAPDARATGVLTWTDLTGTFGDLAPGASAQLRTVFRAIKIDDVVINRARVVAAQGAGGAGGGGADDSAGSAVEGGRVIVEKKLVEQFVRLDTPVISFTIALRNQGLADIVSAPVEDTYRADLLRFRGASVPPSLSDPQRGLLRWDNLLAALGVARLRPGEVVTVTTSYTVTGPIADAVVNSADALGTADEFGNAVQSPRRAEVRIRVVGAGVPTEAPTATPSEVPTAEGNKRPRATATQTATQTATASAATGETQTPVTAGETQTPRATPTPAAQAGPEQLPRTGEGFTDGWLAALALLGLAAGLLIMRWRGYSRPTDE